MSTPRLRDDLKAAPAEEAGLKFFDVSDPRSGASMRLYEHEWLLARRMDGSGSLAEIARWAGEHIGFSPSTQDLAAYAKRLGELGFFDEPVDLTRLTEPGLPDDPIELDHARPREETSFAELGDDNSQTADLRPEVLAAVRANDPRYLVPARGDANGMPATSSHSSTTAGLESGHTEGVRRVTPTNIVVDETPLPPPAPGAVEHRAEHRSAPPQQRTPPSVTTVAPERRVSPPADNLRAQKKPAKRSSMRGAVIALLTVGGIAAAGGVVYETVFSPALQPAKVRVQLVGQAKDIFKYYDGKGSVTKTPPVTLSFGASGKVIDVVSVGTDTKPGMTLASLDSAAATEKELADVRDREAFYENSLRLAMAHHKPADVAKAQSKVNEKKALRAALEDRVSKSRIVASTVSSVVEVLVVVGAPVAAGAPAVKLADKHTLVEAKLAGADAKQIKVGDVISIATSASGSSATGSAKVTATSGDVLKMEVVDDAGGAIKNGEQVSLVKSKLTGVVRIPATAVSKSQGGADRVFVLENGQVNERPVKIAERSDTDVYVTSGLQNGDHIVISPLPTLANGQKAIAE